VTRGKYFLLQDAEDDLIERANYLFEHASDRVMLRFIHAVFATAETLAGMPELGPVCRSANPRLRQLRRFPVNGFKRFFILYHPVPSGIEVIRIVHSSQDWKRLFP
jgi:plasmid stabilization system protein ParE